SKHTNYEEATHIPLLIVAPGVTRPNTRSHALVETVDIYPTLRELAGLQDSKVSQPLEGLSFVPVLKSPRHKTKDAIFHVFPRNRRSDGAILGRAVRTDRYRLVEWKKPGSPASTADFELYDYKADPLETKNLASTKPEIVKQLEAILAAQPEAKKQI